MDQLAHGKHLHSFDPGHYLYIKDSLLNLFPPATHLSSLAIHLLSSLLLIRLHSALIMQQPSSPSQWAGGQIEDGHEAYNSSYAPYNLFYSFAHAQAPTATLRTQPVPNLLSQDAVLSPCFSFNHPSTEIPDIWLNPVMEAVSGTGVQSTTDSSPACSGHNMVNPDAVDCSPALSLSFTNHVEPSDESLL